MLVRSWQFSSFRRALGFVNQVAALAEKHDHHPDIILSSRQVPLQLSTHSDGGLTERAFSFVSEINTLPIDRSGPILGIRTVWHARNGRG
jgi:4a-hydroxytetrahydrobiopterin dehydratase